MNQYETLYTQRITELEGIIAELLMVMHKTSTLLRSYYVNPTELAKGLEFTIAKVKEEK